MRFVVLSAGKAFTEPLLLILVLALGTAITAVIRTPSGNARRLSSVTLAALLVLWILATPAVAMAIGGALLLDSHGVVPPAFIIVPSGGSFHVASASAAVLSSSTAGRVVEAISWWREHPSSLLVFTGGDTTADGTVTDTVDAMRDEAIRRGVPAASIRTEPRSRNTREHVIQLAGMISPETPIGIVTSGWHLRRTQAEFARHFRSIAIRTCEPSRRETLTINDFLPSAWGLRWSTLMLHEWIGIAWYALRS